MKFQEVQEFNSEEITRKLSEIFDRTKKYVYLSTSLYPDFYNQEEIKGEILDLVKDDVEIRVLLDEDINPEERAQNVPWIFNQNIEIRQSKRDVPHWLIADGKHLRLEKEHEPGKAGGPNLIVMNADSMVADVYENSFKNWWLQSKIIRPSN